MHIQNKVVEKVPPTFNISAEEVVRLLNSVREDEISVSDEWNNPYDSDVYMGIYWGMTHDQFEIFLTDGQVYFRFNSTQHDLTNYANPDLFDYHTCWKLDNAGFKELLNNAWEEYMDYVPPEEIDITDRPFTVAGEDLSGYIFIFTTAEGEIRKLTIEVTASAGVEIGEETEWGRNIQLYGASIKGSGSADRFGGEILVKAEQTEDGGTYFKYEKLPFTKSDTRMSISPNGLEGCTVTVTAQPWH
jgi:hypothetical protein